MGEISFKLERITDISTEVLPFIHLVWIEMQQGTPLAPDFAQYMQGQIAGNHFLLTARSEGDLVGVISLFLRPGLRNCTTLTAVTDFIYVAEEARGRGVGKDLLTNATAFLRSKGVRQWHSGARPHADGGKMQRLLEKCGFSPSDVYLELNPMLGGN